MADEQITNGTQTPTEGTPPVTPPTAPAVKTEAQRLASAIAIIKGETPPAAAPTPPAEETKVEAKTEPAKEPKPEEVVSPQLAAVERAKRRAEEAAARTREELAKERAALDARKAELGAVEELTKLLRTDPVAALKKAGVTDFEAAARMLYLESLPEDKRPKDFKIQKQQLETRDEIAALRDKVAAYEKALEEQKAAAAKAAEEAQAKAAQQANVEAYRAKLGAALDALGDASPFLRTYAAHDRAAAVADMLAAAESHYAEHEEIPTPEQVASMVEAAIAARVKPFESVFSKTTSKAVTEEQKPAARTLTSAKTQTPTTARPPAATDSERVKRAAEAAAGIWR